MGSTRRGQYIGYVSDAEGVPGERPAKGRSRSVGAAAMKTHLTLASAWLCASPPSCSNSVEPKGATN